MDWQSLKQQYLQGGISIAALAREHDIDRRHLAKLLRDDNVPMRGRYSLTPAQEEDLCNLYKQGLSGLKLGEQFRISMATAINILKRHNIARRGYSPYEIGCPNYFNIIDTEHKAYWLGFIAADGCIGGNGNRLTIALAHRDKLLLEQMRSDIQVGNPVRDEFPNGYPIARFSFSCAQLAHDLNQHGILPRKTYNLQWPKGLPRDLINHFIRGYVDGDGGYYVTWNKHNNHWNILFSVSSTMVFLKELQSQLIQACNLNKTKIHQDKRRSKLSGSLMYCGRLQVKRIFDYLYKDATVWLPRKRDKVEPYL